MSKLLFSRGYNVCSELNVVRNPHNFGSVINQKYYYKNRFIVQNCIIHILSILNILNGTFVYAHLRISHPVISA